MTRAWTDLGPTGDQVWDAARADDLIGCLVLVGLTHLDPSGEETGKEQFFGHVVSADEHAGVVLKLAGKRDGERVVLPPDLYAITPAQEGVYELSTTHETVRDPDFTATFRVIKRAEG